jgi:hypothetical protein
MDDMTEMTGEDYASVESAQQSMKERGWRPGTLNEHVDGWASLVGEVEVGYSMTVDDYTNDLAVREWLDQVLPMLTERVRDSLLTRLAPLDERFDRATVTPAGPLPGCGTGRWCRLPRTLVDELREDAIRMNLIPPEQ